MHGLHLTDLGKPPPPEAQTTTTPLRCTRRCDLSVIEELPNLQVVAEQPDRTRNCQRHDAALKVPSIAPSPFPPTNSNSNTTANTPSPRPRILRAGDPKPNVTGFDMRKFLAATGNARYDPWERKCVTVPPPPFPHRHHHPRQSINQSINQRAHPPMV